MSAGPGPPPARLGRPQAGGPFRNLPSALLATLLGLVQPLEFRCQVLPRVCKLFSEASKGPSQMWAHCCFDGRAQLTPGTPKPSVRHVLAYFRSRGAALHTLEYRNLRLEDTTSDFPQGQPEPVSLYNNAFPFMRTLIVHNTDFRVGTLPLLVQTVPQLEVLDVAFMHEAGCSFVYYMPNLAMPHLDGLAALGQLSHLSIRSAGNVPVRLYTQEGDARAGPAQAEPAWTLAPLCGGLPKLAYLHLSIWLQSEQLLLGETLVGNPALRTLELPFIPNLGAPPAGALQPLLSVTLMASPQNMALASQLTQLTRLALTRCTGAELALLRLDRCRALREVDLQCLPYAALSPSLEHAPWLTSLRVSRALVQGGSDVSPLASITALRKLHLDMADGRLLEGGLAELTGLTALALTRCRDLRRLPQGPLWQGLADLSLEGCVHLATVPDVLGSCCTRLTALDMGRINKLQLRPAAVARLEALPALRALHLCKCGHGAYTEASRASLGALRASLGQRVDGNPEAILYCPRGCVEGPLRMNTTTLVPAAWASGHGVTLTDFYIEADEAAQPTATEPWDLEDLG